MLEEFLQYLKSLSSYAMIKDRSAVLFSLSVMIRALKKEWHQIKITLKHKHLHFMALEHAASSRT